MGPHFQTKNCRQLRNFDKGKFIFPWDELHIWLSIHTLTSSNGLNRLYLSTFALIRICNNNKGGHEFERNKDRVLGRG